LPRPAGADTVPSLRARRAPLFGGGITMKNRVLVYGMHGYRNLGAEARLVAILDQLRRMAPGARIVTNTMHRTALDYLRGSVELSYFHPALYRPASNRLIASSDVVILSEGAFIGDRFSPALNSATVNAIETAQRHGVASVGLALDSQPLSPERRERTARALNSLTLLTVRAPAAAKDLGEMGVKLPMRVTADCAVSMPLPGDDVRARVRDRFGLGDAPLHALAPVDFYMWPAELRPLARRRDHVRWPYAGTWPDGGRERSERLVREWVEHARYLLSTDRRARVGIVIQDRGDVRIAERIHRELGVPERSFVLNGQASTPFEVSAAYGIAESLTSSRYHANVLASAYGTPHVALGHDNRTRYFSEDLGLERYFVAHDDPDVPGSLRELHGALMADADAVRERTLRVFAEMRARDAVNYELLADVLEGAGHRVERPSAPQPAPAG
jgi:polysaccharide pyruvyl transferase WcaK-like protein